MRTGTIESSLGNRVKEEMENARARRQQLDAWNFISRTKSVESYALTTKYRLNKSCTRRAKSAIVHRRRPCLESACAQSEAESLRPCHSVAASTDFFDYEFPDEFDYDAPIKTTEDELLEQRQVYPPPTPSQEMYHKACKRFKVIPASYFYKNLKGENITMKHHSLGAVGGKVCALALMNNSSVTQLNLTENNLGPEGAAYIAEMLRENAFITDLTIADNNIAIEGAKSIVRVVMELDNLTRLDLSGNGLRECDAECFRHLIEDSRNLKSLNLSHNEFREAGGEVLGQAIEWNESLTELDLSWNHLRRDGAVAIAEGIQMNSCLRKLNLAWNGFYLEGCKALAKSLENNTTLQEIDLSSNRINKECLDKLLAGIKKNKTLQKIGLAWNPITNAGAVLLLNSLQECQTLNIMEVDIHTQVVDLSYVAAVNKLQIDRGITINYGVIRDQEGDGNDHDEDDLVDENPVLVLMEFGKLMGFRLMDLFAALDKDGSKSLDKVEIKSGLKFANIPLKDKALNHLIEKLDVDGDGEIDFMELMQAQQEHRKKMNKMYQAAKTNVNIEDTEVGRIRIKLQRLMAKQMAENPAFKSRVASFKTFIDSSVTSEAKRAEVSAKTTGSKREINRARVLQRRATQNKIDTSSVSSKRDSKLSVVPDSDSVKDNKTPRSERNIESTADEMIHEKLVLNGESFDNVTLEKTADITNINSDFNDNFTENKDSKPTARGYSSSETITIDNSSITKNSRNKSNISKTTNSSSRPGSGSSLKTGSRPGSAVIKPSRTYERRAENDISGEPRKKTNRPRSAYKSGIDLNSKVGGGVRSRPGSATSGSSGFTTNRSANSQSKHNWKELHF